MMLLLLTNGTASIDAVMDIRNGKVLPKAAVCQSGLKYVKSFSLVVPTNNLTPREDAAQRMRGEEESDMKCHLTQDDVDELHRLKHEHAPKGLEAFRSALTKWKLRAIDVIHWDGKERDADSIIWAISHYPRSSSAMTRFIRALIIIGAVSAMAAIAFRSASQQQQQKSVGPKEEVPTKPEPGGSDQIPDLISTTTQAAGDNPSLQQLTWSEMAKRGLYGIGQTLWDGYMREVERNKRQHELLGHPSREWVRQNYHRYSNRR